MTLLDELILEQIKRAEAKVLEYKEIMSLVRELQKIKKEIE
jgi:hypothetical protein